VQAFFRRVAGPENVVERREDLLESRHRRTPVSRGFSDGGTHWGKHYFR
jgi:hypothetical protein